MLTIETLNVEELKNAIVAEAKIRLESGEVKDPICVLAEEIQQENNSITRTVMEFIYKAHMYGPWVVDNDAKLQVYKDYCEKAGTPIINQVPIMVEGVPVYFDDQGDCVLQEASKGRTYAIWTNDAKHRIQIGFKTDSAAIRFRQLNSGYSMKATKNRHLGLVVIERNPMTMDLLLTVCKDLYRL